MTNTEQIRALIAYYKKTEDDCHKAQARLYPPCPRVKRQAEVAANSRQAIAEMLEDNERMREEIKHLMGCKEFERNLQRQIIDVGAKYVTKELGSTYTVTDAWEGIKQALKGTDLDCSGSEFCYGRN